MPAWTIEECRECQINKRTQKKLQGESIICISGRQNGQTQMI